MKYLNSSLILSIFLLFSLNGCLPMPQVNVNPEWTVVAEKAMQSVCLIKVFESVTGTPELYSIGTGFVITSDGYLLTNVHVIVSTLKLIDPLIKVTFENGSSYEVVKKVLLPEFDVAILKIKAHALPFLEFEFYRKVERGEHILSLGHPWPFNFSLTEGVVSSTEYQLNSSNKFKWIQVDNHLNPGMSGGPTIDRNGKVIGINQAMGARHQGVSLLIPAIELHTHLIDALPSNVLTTCQIPE